ncbi:hypothetical protein [Pannonibacter indicus]|jgi:methyl-accepting chemotaxis protein|uniref:Methyl-accepting chemotaxis protein (MCP) signalling domain n=1 Tax=Pannonibacter indicus TaxID=466044 RepID=A0A0K6HUH9_9HYPH|nr:hypothetical protein [Pannonibacter indicus]CUA94438.1 hypothetical protein Ga0061067_103175 [Pannonibacter indicus]
MEKQNAVTLEIARDVQQVLASTAEVSASITGFRRVAEAAEGLQRGFWCWRAVLPAMRRC